MKTVLITGCSSGFGLETARHFLAHDWQVVATMRTPQADLLPASPRLRVLPLDVTDAESIAACVQAAGPIDVLVNNAGIGVLTPLEATSAEAAREVFETNTLGTIAMTRAVLPQMRERGQGVVVNVTSTVTVRPLPLLSVYTASKAAVNAFTESLAVEVAPFGVRATLVLPGAAPSTQFGRNAAPRMQGAIPDAYAPMVQEAFDSLRAADRPITHATDVAEAVLRAATDPDCPRRLPAGTDAWQWATEAGIV
ncbi:SDR family oxidoreductase [Pseudoxanthomonas sp. JBR18]|uniref:SDR family oxidoreductase n=1 Tax=Pseudoxanthomonas sp. JBR18 TaxID=2969308 RepID=UPI00230538D7|nr:SDR family oxidoreductase [Pseudoxanthomonas sp. JBR18]WCE04885.1 SDR family oxidoreductase [Pseudoxanthomonas sp. JBR18]